MSYKQIDEQFDERFVCRPESAFSEEERWVLHHKATRENLKSFLHLIYDQAKAEQREADARIAEDKRVIGCFAPKHIMNILGITCDSIAKKIREGK